MFRLFSSSFGSLHSTLWCNLSTALVFVPSSDFFPCLCFQLVSYVDLWNINWCFFLWQTFFPVHVPISPDFFPCSTKRSHVAHFETSIDEAFSWDKGLLVLLCFVHYCRGHFIHLGRGFVILGSLKDLILHWECMTATLSCITTL